MFPKRLFAVAMSTIIALSLLPSGAFASAQNESLHASDGDSLADRSSEVASAHANDDNAKAVRRVQAQIAAKRHSRVIHRVKVHRLYNLWSGEHFYSIDAAECAYLVNEGWLYEGTGWQAPSWSGTPVYRLYDPQAGTHLFTADERERWTLTEWQGWNDDGVVFFADEDSRRVPVYRLYNRWSGEHFFTADKGERKNLMKQGWKAEGVGWYAAAPGVPLKSVNYRAVHWRYFLDCVSGSSDVTVQNGSLSSELSERLGQYTRTGVPVGFVAINKRTGKTVACSPDYREFSASSMKAVYSTALCKYGAPGIGSHAGQLYNTLTYSSNADYDSLFYTYGMSYLRQIMSEACVSPDLRYARAYADVTPRELAKLWLVISDYLQEPGANADLLRSSFGLGEYYKEGWMYSGTWCGQMYHVAGVQGDVVYAIMSRWMRPSASMWNLRDDLFAAVG